VSLGIGCRLVSRARSSRRCPIAGVPPTLDGAWTGPLVGHRPLLVEERVGGRRTSAPDGRHGLEGVSVPLS
jgi:hypothetical protein